MARASDERSPRRPSRGARRSGSRGRSPPGPTEESDSNIPSPGSWDVPRGRSRVRKPDNPLSEDNLGRRGYHALLTPFGKVFHVEKRWKLIREMGSGAYGVVISAADEISGETVAIKQVTRVLDKVPLAKRALREITLLRHFANHENITGLIDLDAISPDFNEIYIFLEPMEADLHQIIKSGQGLTTEHVQYFLYQLLRGMKYIHTAGVVHRDLKPGNLLVNADCELKICDFGLSRGFDERSDDSGTHMTEYVATRWYRAPEIMLAFRRYGTAIDMWSIGCIFAELLTGKTLFKGKDYIDQLNKILEGLGTPDEDVITRIGSDKAQAYVRSLPFSRGVPLHETVPMADPEALTLLEKMLAFDPAQRINVVDSLDHVWLASYHDVSDEPECPVRFERWRELEKLETIEEYRNAIWTEIQDYRREARWSSRSESVSHSPEVATRTPVHHAHQPSIHHREPTEPTVLEEPEPSVQELLEEAAEQEHSTETTLVETADIGKSDTIKPFTFPSKEHALENVAEEPDAPQAVDPVVSYARRSSIMRSNSHTAHTTYVPHTRGGHKPIPSFDGSVYSHPSASPVNPVHPGNTGTMPQGIPFPSSDGDTYVMPSRNRTMSFLGGEASRKLLRTLSTLSIHETGEGMPGGLAQVAPIGQFIREPPTADMPFSEMPEEFTAEWPTRKPQAQGTPGKKKTFHIG